MSTTHLRAMAHQTQAKMKQYGERPLGIEGLDTGGEWVLLDYGDIVVHLFMSDTREFYNLERLWGDGTIIEWAEKDAVGSESTPCNTETGHEEL